MYRRLVSFGTLLLLLGAPIVAHAASYDLSISSSKSVVEPRENFVYTVRLRNRGSSDENTTVTLTLDDQIDVVSISDGGKRRGDAIVWEKLSIGEDSARTFSAIVRVNSNAKNNARLRSIVYIGGTYEEIETRVINTNDNDESAERHIRAELLTNRSAVQPDEAYTYLVRLFNDSPFDAKNIKVEIELPDNVEFLTATNKGKGNAQHVTWSNIDLDGGERRELTASVRANDEVKHGDTLHATAYAEGFAMDHTMRVVDPTEGQEDVQIHAFASKDRAKAGDSITYTMHVRNLENKDEYIDLRAYFDAGQSFTSATEGGEQYDQTMVQWENVFLKQSATTSVRFTTSIYEDVLPGQQLHVNFQAGRASRDVAVTVLASGTGSLFGFGPSASFGSQSARSNETPNTVALPQTGAHWLVPTVQASESVTFVAQSIAPQERQSTKNSSTAAETVSILLAIVAGTLAGATSAWRRWVRL